MAVEDDAYNLIMPEFKKPDPRAFGPGYVLAAESHIRSSVDAPEKLPASE